jgi:hypothetical protein
VQSVAAGWTAEERDSVRKIAENFQVSWHRQSTLGNRTFTIGVSTIGGNDAIGINPGALGSPANYRYFNESAYVTSLSWERGLNMPTGGLSEALAEATLDNTSGRFTPRYMGGRSELYTAILPNRPMLISAGFNFGVDQTIQQFAGIVKKQPQVDQRSKSVLLQGNDYVDYFQHKYLDNTVMWTGLRTDQALTNVATQVGMNTAQYDFDYGINVIPFAVFNSGTKFSDIIHQLVEAENGHFYQDENGIFKFHNRQWGDSSPYNQVQRVIATAQVIEAQSPNDDHIINVVEITGSVYQKQPLQLLFSLPAGTSISIPANGTTDQFFQFQDPVLQLTEPTNGGDLSFYAGNTQPDNSGTDATSSIQVKNLGLFSQAVKYRLTNTSSQIVYLTQFALSGRVAKKTSNLYYREQDDSSVTAYQERALQINNDFIQNPDWAKSYARMILNDFSDAEHLQTITIRALPELQLFDLISWQGRYWHIYNIKSKLDPSVGYVQELLLLQRTITTYFRIGISTIGGGDRIAP